MNQGIVCKITQLDPIYVKGNKADSIQKATIMGHSVIVGNKIQLGDLGVFFLGGDIELSEQFVVANDLMVQRDEFGKKTGGGYIESDRRIRVVKLLGVKSEGIFCPISNFDFATKDIGGEFHYKEGDSFDTLNGIPICKKFIHPHVRTVRENRRAIEKTKRAFSPSYFAQHMDTDHLRSKVDKIPSGALLYITLKLHGTSGRTGFIPAEIATLSIFDKCVKRLYETTKNRFMKNILKKTYMRDPKYTREYRVVTGTRRTILNSEGLDSFYSDNFRKSIELKYFVGKIKRGEVFYYEIVGYQENGKPIMGTQSVSKLKDRDMLKRYGDTMTYTYGCMPNDCEIYVYRITQIGDDGHTVELSWPQVKKRCKELGINFVPEVSPIPIIYDGDKETLIRFCDQFLDKSSMLDMRHIEEGVCVRVESIEGLDILKHKSFLFRSLESSAKEDVNFTDQEEEA